MPRPDRRRLIADAAIVLAASGGTHAVTHQAVDRYLALPKGSASYYFRTRDALLAAAAEQLIGRSRERFQTWLTAPDVDPLELIAGYTTELVTVRRGDVRARAAMLLDPGLSVETRKLLVQCLFSADAAARLMTDFGSTNAQESARWLISVLEGVVFTHVFEADLDAAVESESGASSDAEQLSFRIQTHVAGVLSTLT